MSQTMDDRMRRAERRNGNNAGHARCLLSDLPWSDSDWRAALSDSVELWLARCVLACRRYSSRALHSRPQPTPSTAFYEFSWNANEHSERRSCTLHATMYSDSTSDMEPSLWIVQSGSAAERSRALRTARSSRVGSYVLDLFRSACLVC